MTSPFLYDSLASKDNFFGRLREIEELKKTTKYSNNLLIFSKRRMGKTTLVKHFLSLQEDKYLCLYIDIFDMTSKEGFAKALLSALTNSQKSDIKLAIKTLTSLFKRVRVEPSIDPVTLEYSIKPIVSTLSFEDMMDDFFDSIKKIAKKKKIIIAIDEFQQIATLKNIKLDAYLRKYIQDRENISYIFLGSKRHLLTSLFSYKAPMFELATHFELPPLKQEDIFSYAKKYLDITKEQIDYIYEKSDGETKLLLHILHLLYIQEKSISNELINTMISEIINSKDATFRMLFDTLSNNQKIALKVVGKYSKGIFSQDVLNEYNIKKQTLQSAIEVLTQKEFIDKSDQKYFIPDRTFEIWVENKI